MLPLIPLILGISSIAAVLTGGKKALDAKRDFAQADDYNSRARNIYGEATDRLDEARKSTNRTLEQLGRRKAETYETGFMPFVDCASKIKNLDFDEAVSDKVSIPCSEAEFIEFKELALQVSSILAGGAAALGGGALAGFGALGGVGFLATASTGTAIASLSGVAATNATLAWFGGGSLAAGGLGMSVGAAVVGGVFVAPIIAVGGMLLASKAKEAHSEAYSNLKKAEVAAESLRTACVAAKAIWKRAKEIYGIISQLQPLFGNSVAVVKYLVSKDTDYRNYSRSDKEEVCRCFSLAKTTKNILEVPVFDENGTVTQRSKDVLKATREFLSEIARI
ncbi:hypothetical protein FACS189460_5790 [Deltaproteobacteria bacterium]|nr:hypothetical protein FACS189460_5790 [Deltaproteobacteria bacterium]